MTDAPSAPGGTVAATLDGDGLARGVATSALGQVSARGLHLALNVVSTLVIIHHLGADGYGDYVLVLTATTLVGVLADYGLGKLAVREITRRPDEEPAVLGTVVALRLGLALVAMVVVQGLLALLGSRPEVHLAALVLSTIYLADAVLVLAVVFQVRLRQQWEALVRVVIEVIETAMVLVLVARDVPLPVLFVAPPLAAALGAAVTVALVRRRFGTRLAFEPGRVPGLLHDGLPLGPALLIGVVYLKLEGLMLAALADERAVGLFGAAYQPIEYLFLASGVLILVLFPVLARAHGRDHERFQTVYRRGAESLVAVLVVVPATLAFVAEPLLRTVFGAEFAEADTVLLLLGVTLVIITVNGWQAFVLLAGDRQRLTLAYNAVALAVAVGLDLVLIPRWGIEGAAVATVISALVVFALSTTACRRALGATLAVEPLVRILAAAALLVVALAGLDRLGVPWPLVALAPLLLQPVALLATGVVRPTQVRLALDAVRRHRRAPGAPRAPGAAPVEAEVLV